MHVPADLEPWLVCSWEAHPSGRTQLTPDGCSDLLCTSVGGVVVCGPEKRSWEFELPAGTTAVGVRFRAGQAGAFFGIDVSTIADRQVPLDAILGPRTGHDADGSLQAACSSDAPVASRREALLDWVRRRSVDRTPDATSEAIIRHMLDDPTVSQEELAAGLGMSIRTLHRHTLRRFGYGTATIARLLRFQRLLAISETASSGTSLSVLAARAGYADHAHLVRDCRAISDQPPTSFLAHHFPTFPDVSDPYKTGRPLAATIGE